MTHPVITATPRDTNVVPHPAESFWQRGDYVPPPALRTPPGQERRPLARADLKPQPPERDLAAGAAQAPGVRSGLTAQALLLEAPLAKQAAAQPPGAKYVKRQARIAAQIAARHARIDANGYGAGLWAWVTAQPGPVDYAAAMAAVPGGQAATYLARWARQGRLRVRRCPLPAGREWPLEPGHPAPAGGL